MAVSLRYTVFTKSRRLLENYFKCCKLVPISFCISYFYVLWMMFQSLEIETLFRNRGHYQCLKYHVDMIYKQQNSFKTCVGQIERSWIHRRQRWEGSWRAAFVKKNLGNAIGVARGDKGAVLPNFLACHVVLCFERWCPKQSTVVRLKSNYLPSPKFWAGYATTQYSLKSDWLNVCWRTFLLKIVA